MQSDSLSSRFVQNKWLHCFCSHSDHVIQWLPTFFLLRAPLTAYFHKLYSFILAKLFVTIIFCIICICFPSLSNFFSSVSKRPAPYLQWNDYPKLGTSDIKYNYFCFLSCLVWNFHFLMNPPSFFFFFRKQEYAPANLHMSLSFMSLARLWQKSGAYFYS